MKTAELFVPAFYSYGGWRHHKIDLARFVKRLFLEKRVNYQTLNDKPLCLRHLYDWNPDTFYKDTTAEWKFVKEPPKREPDYVSDSGSEYWYQDGGVYRRSDHWGLIGEVSWWILGEGLPDESRTNRDGTVFFWDAPVTGFARWYDFEPILKQKPRVWAGDLWNSHRHRSYRARGFRSGFGNYENFVLPKNKK